MDAVDLTTNLSRTRTISIPAPPEVVLELVGDARNLPRWAPGFAATARPSEHDGVWLIGSDGGEFPIVLRVSGVLGTVDILDPADPRRGAFTRVVPNGDGSEYIFTLFFPDGTPAAAIDEQMRTVEQELAVVRELSERRWSGR